MSYTITILFTGGTLAGMTYTYTSDRPLTVGWECRKPTGGSSPYRVISCV